MSIFALKINWLTMRKAFDVHWIGRDALHLSIGRAIAKFSDDGFCRRGHVVITSRVPLPDRECEIGHRVMRRCSCR
jgi:hypothetical protein